jgi:hypothetical protein
MVKRLSTGYSLVHFGLLVMLSFEAGLVFSLAVWLGGVNALTVYTGTKDLFCVFENLMNDIGGV